MEEKNKNKHIIIKIMLLLCILSAIAVAVFAVSNMKTEQKNKDVMKEIFESVEMQEANLTEYIVYGTHLSIKGELVDQISNIKSVALLFSGLSEENREIELNYEKTANGITFSTPELLNEGIDLENMNIDKHIMLINVKYINKER